MSNPVPPELEHDRSGHCSRCGQPSSRYFYLCHTCEGTTPPAPAPCQSPLRCYCPDHLGARSQPSPARLELVKP